MSDRPDFDSDIAVEKETPFGGKIKFGVGGLFWPDGRKLPAIAIQIDDESGDQVAQFALRMESFATLLEGMMEVFAHAQEQARKDDPA